MALFDKAKDRFLKGEIDLLTAPLKVMLKAGAPLDFQVSDTLADIPAGDRVAIEDLINPQLIPGLDPAELWFTADDLTFFSVSGPQVVEVVIYVEGPDDANSPLVWARSASFTPNGLNISVQWGSYIFAQGCKGANKWYDVGKQNLFQGACDFSANDIHAVLVDAAYVADFVAHTELGDIPLAARVGDVIGYPLAGKQVGINDGLQGGVFDADDVIIPALVGDDVVGIALIKYLSATPEDSPLIGFITEGLNFPLVPDGSLTGIVWSNADGRIIRI